MSTLMPFLNGTLPTLRRPRARRDSQVRSWFLERLEERAVPATIAVTSLADAGPGTLRAAIILANADPDADTVTFAPSVRGTITLETALPNLATAIDIEGPGPSALTIARSADPTTPRFHIFEVDPGADITISDITITGGNASYGEASATSAR